MSRKLRDRLLSYVNYDRLLRATFMKAPPRALCPHTHGARTLPRSILVEEARVGGRDLAAICHDDLLRGVAALAAWCARESVGAYVSE